MIHNATLKDWGNGTWTAQEIISFVKEFLLEKDLDTNRLVNEDYDDLVHGEYYVEQVDSEGGHEGEGENMEITYGIYKNGAIQGYFQIQGLYNSWDFNEWYEDIHPVEAYEYSVVNFRTLK